ncbi:LysR family transcriptional regulator [Dechloromonas sp. TW-R-39-2]|uniref:LysR family transcriptional regulator n=1 Tax=Dechloromonas sp. TW-R-39-2 TaxID=2654218 RepID=UPI00193E7D82|nr:LysR family transcriptional regulator [Dechloromonas sp. TW-R-39-2]QRM18554.1 LysR family transcriptional regulator [Dechloromonas sp. TW-R-39-2]
MSTLNYKHLHYFWVVAQEGSITRAAERLDVAVQTISGQLSLLERQLGKALFNSQGRGLVLSDAGRLALGYADQIFQLGDALVDALESSDSESTLRLRAGITDGIPKLLAYRLLSSVTSMPAEVRLICEEGEFEPLLADLALHRLDIVLTDRAAPVGGNLKVFSTRLGDFETGLFGNSALVERYKQDFPHSLNGAPMLLPTRHNALRGRIDRWLEQGNIRPKIVAEFEDSALLTTFGRGGLGLFPAPLALAEQVASQLDAIPLGAMPGVSEQIYAISNERRIRHPAIEVLCNASPQGAAEPRV